MRLAVLSPVTPQRSAISDYTEELLPHLRRHADVDVWVDSVVPTNPVVTDHAWFDFGRDPALVARLGAYDGVLCHMGNDGRWHGGIYDVIRRTPTVVVLHDIALPHFFHSLADRRKDTWVYLTELERQHGRAERELAEAAFQVGAELPHAADSLRVPMIKGIVEAAAGIVVHGAWAKRRIDALEIPVPVRDIGFPVAARPAPSPGSREPFVRIATFGLVTPEKGIERTLRVLRSLVGAFDFEYWVVGDPHPSLDVRALADEMGLGHEIVVTGHVSAEEFDWRLGQVDIGVNLRERTAGETSYSLLRLQAAGVPTIVSDLGAFAELHEGTVIKLAHGPDEDLTLRAILLELARDSGLRRRIGRAAWERTRDHHSPEQAAVAYIRFVEQVSLRRARRVVTAANAAALGRFADEPAVASTLAEVVHELVPEPAVRFVAPARVAASASGRVAPPEGVDWAAGASGYLRRIGDVERHYLLTKPYYDIHEPPEGLLGDGVDGETARHLGDAAEIATLLALAPDSTVLDAACGSGWLTEHLARFGWQVTGADLSAELVELARSRLAAQPFAAAPGRPLRARFVVHDLTQGPLAQTFDAVVCYDALHHLADERAAVAHLAAMVAPGGLLLIVEGARPTPGSQGERELQDVMAKYQTLESPFDHNHLLALVEATGLTVIGDYLGPLGVYERGEVVGGRVPVAVREHHRLLSRRMLGPTTGTTANGADGLRAQWAVRATVPLEAAPGQAFSLPVAVTNAGARAWLADRPGRTGSVSVAATVDGVSQRWVALPRIVGPREQADLELEVVAPLTRGTHRITVDLVAHDVSWFGDAGSEVLSLPLRVR